MPFKAQFICLLTSQKGLSFPPAVSAISKGNVGTWHKKSQTEKGDFGSWNFVMLFFQWDRPSICANISSLFQ